MIKTQQQKDNKLIAKFMGLTIIPDGISYFDTNYKVLKNYHSDWNRLMEVVEKIESKNIENKECISFLVKITNCTCQIVDIFKDRFEINIHAETKIKAVYNACIEFIKWYNENQLQSVTK